MQFGDMNAPDTLNQVTNMMLQPCSSAGMRLSREGGVEGEEWEKLEREG
jgi:hypothetical protein